jgi:hypothetical protein
MPTRKAAAAPAGYSGTPLVRKLGIKEDTRLGLFGAPDGFRDLLVGLGDGVEVRTRAGSPLSVIVTFHVERAHFERRLPVLLRSMDRDGGLWVAWPKKAAKVPTDMTEDVVREVALPLGLVDNKVCAIDDTWSALRFVVRKSDRPGRT